MPYESHRGRAGPVPLGDRRYLLSPQDLAGLDAVADLAQAGVASLKIEGRLKSPEYVAGITRVYRAALNRLRAPEPVSISSADDRYELEMSFSRGLHTGWLRGIDNQRLVHARFGKKRGVYLGTVRRVRGERVYMEELQSPLKPGDGVVFDAGQPDQAEQGGRVYGLEPDGRRHHADVRTRRYRPRRGPSRRPALENQRPGVGPPFAADVRGRRAAIPAAGGF